MDLVMCDLIFMVIDLIKYKSSVLQVIHKQFSQDSSERVVHSQPHFVCGSLTSVKKFKMFLVQ